MQIRKPGVIELINLKLTNSRGIQRIEINKSNFQIIEKVALKVNSLPMIKAPQIDMAKIVTIQKKVSPPS